MARRRHELSDEDWALLEPLLPQLRTPGRHYRDHRTVLNGMLFRLNIGIPWRDLPDRHSHMTFFLLIDALFLGSNLLKVSGGGWFPLFIGLSMLILMTTWRSGRRILTERLREDAVGLEDFLGAVFVNPPHRVPGVAVFLTSSPDIAPNAFVHNLKHNKFLHERNVFVCVRYHEVPRVEKEDRMTCILWVSTAGS
jgi:K+ transporter